MDGPVKTVEEMLDTLFAKASYVFIEDGARDLTKGVVACKACGASITGAPNFCATCGVQAPAKRVMFDHDLRWSVTASTHGICYPNKSYAADWRTALREAYERATEKDS